MRQATRTAALKSFDECRVVLAEQRAELVGDLLAVPDGILLSARQHGDGLRQLRVGWQWPMRGPVGAQNVGQQLSVNGRTWSAPRCAAHGTAPPTAD